MPKKTHEENLRSVCCVCGRKGGKFRNVSQDIAAKVVQHFQPTYERNGGVHPTAICDSCRKACMDPKQTESQNSSTTLPSDPQDPPPELAKTLAANALSVSLEVWA